MKFYAVRKGNKQGIFISSKEFKESIEGVDEPQYKIFKTEKDAESYMARYYMRSRRKQEEN